MSVITGVMQGVSKLQRFRLNSTFPNMIPSRHTLYWFNDKRVECFGLIQGKYRSIERLKNKISQFNDNEVAISTNSLTATTVSDNSIDYIFTDPPFGANLNYSELSFMWNHEGRVVTNNL